MNYRKREAELERLFYKCHMRLAKLGSEAHINELVILRLSCLAWELKQKYRAQGMSWYVSQKAYKADLEKITALEELIESGAHVAEARLAVVEIREYLELIAGYRVKCTKKNRVF